MANNEEDMKLIVDALSKFEEMLLSSSDVKLDDIKQRGNITNVDNSSDVSIFSAKIEMTSSSTKIKDHLFVGPFSEEIDFAVLAELHFTNSVVIKVDHNENEITYSLADPFYVNDADLIEIELDHKYDDVKDENDNSVEDLIIDQFEEYDSDDLTELVDTNSSFDISYEPVLKVSID